MTIDPFSSDDLKLTPEQIAGLTPLQKNKRSSRGYPTSNL